MTKLLETRYHLIGSGWCEIKIALLKEYTKSQPRGVREITFAKQGNPWGGIGSQANLIPWSPNPMPCNANPKLCRSNLMPFGIRPNSTPCSASPTPFLRGTNLRLLDTNQMPGGANPNVFGANPSVYGVAVGGAGSRNPPTVFLPVPFWASNEGFNFSDQMYGNFHSDYNNQSSFNTYGGACSVGYNYGLQGFGAPFTNCNVQINEAAP